MTNRSEYEVVQTVDADDSLWQWRKMVEVSIRVSPGQRFLKDLLDSLRELPMKELITGSLEDISGKYCALGALGHTRGLNLQNLQTKDMKVIAKAFEISHYLAREIAYLNDEILKDVSPSERWQKVCEWIRSQIKGE